MQQNDGTVAVGQASVHDCLRHALHRRRGIPLIGLHVPAHVPIPELGQFRDQAGVVGAGTERAPEPRVGIDPRRSPDDGLGIGQVFSKSLDREERHPGVVVRVAADQVAARNPARQVRVCLSPSALEEKGRVELEALQLVEHLDGPARLRRAVRMLGVEGERDPEPAGYFSTPVITTPRMKTRWKIRKMITGTMRVSSVPAWISPGSWAERLALNCARPTASVWSSGFVER